MTPPTDLAPWATDQTNNTPPSSSQKASGWTPGQDGVSSYDNWWKHAIHVWIVFINSLFDSLVNMVLPAGLTTAGGLTVGPQPLAFADFTFAVAGNLISRSGHGLETGDGPIRVSNSGGALPGGLLPEIDYYWIKVDADNGLLALSREEALARHSVAIVSAGTGTLQHQVNTTRISNATIAGNLSVAGMIHRNVT